MLSGASQSQVVSANVPNLTTHSHIFMGSFNLPTLS